MKEKGKIGELTQAYEKDQLERYDIPKMLDYTMFTNRRTSQNVEKCTEERKMRERREEGGEKRRKRGEKGRERRETKMERERRVREEDK